MRPMPAVISASVRQEGISLTIVLLGEDKIAVKWVVIYLKACCQRGTWLNIVEQMKDCGASGVNMCSMRHASSSLM